ncbi:unnamed protein product [Ambrosiozyma monospora]|uniref:Unnamed protein product n=1 Tax=Ambrosiozyma monospora TaxID=43982 RepID=A0ACB5SRS4_AMBMO|nr:unnamed protein product [Ambrosiozyma monospora]
MICRALNCSKADDFELTVALELVSSISITGSKREWTLTVFDLDFIDESSVVLESTAESTVESDIELNVALEFVSRWWSLILFDRGNKFTSEKVWIL